MNAEQSILSTNFLFAKLDGEIRVMAAEGKLKGLRSVRIDIVRDGLDDGLQAEKICRSLTLFNRQVVQAVLKAHEQEYPWLSECSFMEFGSGGRHEQVLGSDQDNGLLGDGGIDPDEMDQACGEIVVALDGAGLPLCPGQVMISNSQWRGDFNTWLKRLTSWLSNPQEKGPWQSGLILDFEPVSGPVKRALELRDHLWDYVRNRPVVLSILVQELTDYHMPLTFFGSFITEKKGNRAGALNIKASVLAHLTNAARVLALKYGLRSTNTCDRIRSLQDAGHISRELGASLLDIWEWVQLKRLWLGLESQDADSGNQNYVMPSELSRHDVGKLKGGIHAIDHFVRLVQSGAGL